MTDTVHGAAPVAAARVSDAYRWTQLTIGVLAMVMIANYQYGWTFFVPDIQKKFGWDRASIQWAFTLFVLFETWLVPVEGWFVDKYGPRIVVLIGGILCAIGWAINAQATSLNGYYLGMIIAGIGAFDKFLFLFHIFNKKIDCGCSNDVFACANRKCDNLARFLLSTGITYTKVRPRAVGFG